MSDALNEAKQLIQDAYYHDRDRADVERAMACAIAAIAQAEQLKRIADMLEGYLATHDNPTLMAVRAAE